jgi:hypothetical protein
MGILTHCLFMSSLVKWNSHWMPLGQAEQPFVPVLLSQGWYIVLNGWLLAGFRYHVKPFIRLETWPYLR